MPDTDSRYLRLRLLYALLPLLALDTVLFAARLLERIELFFPRPDRMELQDWLNISASFFFFHFGIALFAIGLVRCSRRPDLAIWFLRVLALLISLCEIVGHIYFMITGDSLDFFQLVYALQRPREVWLIARAGANEARWLLAVALYAVLLAAPRLHRRFIPRPASTPRAPLLTRRAGWMLLLGGIPIAAMGALVFADPRLDAMARRDPAINLATTLIASWTQDPATRARHVQGLRPFERHIVRVRARAPRNVVIVVLESTRAASTTPYAPALKTTPFLDELSHRSLLVEHAYSVITRTPKALVAVLCGLEPAHSVLVKSRAMGLLYGCLPALLDDQGYTTVYFQSANQRLDDRIGMAYEMGFRQYVAPGPADTLGLEQPNVLGPEDDSLLAPTRRWLLAHPKGPFLAAYLTVNAHYHCQPLTRHGFVAFDGDAEVNCYDNAVRADDIFLRSLFDLYREAGRFNDTLFVVIADHGEAFFEHGLGGHNNVPYDEALHIPFLIHDPSGLRIPPGRISEPRTQLDLLPTLLEALDFRVEGHLPGTSLFVPTPERPVMATCLQDESCLVRIQGREKYIDHYWRRGPELFDLGNDPGERVNLADLYPDRVASAREEVFAWHASVVRQYQVEEERNRRRQ